MSRLTFTAACVCILLGSPARSTHAQAVIPHVAARLEFSTFYAFGYTWPDFRQYVDVNLGTAGRRRVWLDSVQRLTCMDADMRPHRAYRIPGDPGEFGVRPATADIFVVIDMKSYECPVGRMLYFVDIGDVETDEGDVPGWKIVNEGESEHTGELLLWDPS